MSILIDTDVFLWAAGVQSRLSDNAKSILEDSKQPIFFSAVSAWEISIKWSKGRIELPDKPAEVIQRIVSTANLSLLPVTSQDACAVAELPFHHKDLFDRLLVAQAKHNKLQLMTANPTLEKYDVDVIALWLDDEDE